MLRQKKIYLEVKRPNLPIIKRGKAEPNGGPYRNMLYMETFNQKKYKGKRYLYSCYDKKKFI